MDKQLAIIFMIAGALLLIVTLFMKNNKDRKDLFNGKSGSDPVEEEHTLHQYRTDKV